MSEGLYENELKELGKKADETLPKDYWQFHIIAERLISIGHFLKSKAAEFAREKYNNASPEKDMPS